MLQRLRPTRLAHVVDGARLRAQLSAAALAAVGDPAAQRRAAIDILKAALFRGRMIVKERLENGAGGRETARLLAGVTDQVIGALYDFTTVHMIRARNPTAGERITMVAVGGYGRRALAPFSDIDLLFLRPYKETAHTESVIEYMLYALWDLGFKVGHASRTIADCLKVAREDMTIRTALLEARPLAGEASLADELTRRFRDEVVRGAGAEFVAAKLKERDARHARAGASRFLVEPNVKDGKGGLRDLHTLFWIAQHLRPDARLDEAMRLDIFDAHEVRVFARAFDFLEAVRAHLHFAAGRAEERLSFDLQPEIARRMGYHDRGRPNGDVTPAVERFMRRYFLIAKDVGVLTRVFSAKLEAEHLKAAPRGLSRLIPSRGPRRRVAERGFVVDGGRLSVEGPAVFDADAVNLLRLFQIADDRDLDLHPDALAAVGRRAGLIGERVRRDPAAARCFLDLLVRGRRPQRALELMNEAGVLGRYLPEFGRIVARMQFNMYHSYTVDEHTLRAVGILADLLAGRLANDLPSATQASARIEHPDVLLLAMLLHDTGKGGAGGQEEAGARAARRACERLGLEPGRVDLVAWLVGHHLAMSDVAQKRDINDPSTIAAFAQLVQTPERLRLLWAMTIADIQAVGPGVWNGWKAQLLRELHAATEAVFRGGRAADAAGVARRRQEALAAEARLALAAVEPVAERWAASLEDAYFSQFDAAEQRAHFDLARRASAGEHVAVDLWPKPEAGATEVVVAARDRPALFADLARAIAAAGGDIAGARIFTSAAGEALDIFHVRDAAGAPFGADNSRSAERLRQSLIAVGRGLAPTAETAAASPLERPSPFTVVASVVVDNDASPSASVIEASGYDRPGLLAVIARTLSGAGLSIQSAHVDSYGQRAVDAFYVVDETGAKVIDPPRLEIVREQLTAVLHAIEPPARRLPRARANAGR